MNTSPTIMHLITGLSTGGAERALFNLLSAGGGGRAVVVSLRDGGTYGPRIRKLGIPVHELCMRSGVPGPAVLAHLRRIVREAEPKLVQGWMYHGNLAASLAGWLAPGRPAIAWNVRHSLYDLGWEKPMTRQVIRANRALSSRADAIVYNSYLSREQHEAFGLAADRGCVIPNGFDTEALQPYSEDAKRAVRQQLGLPEEAVVIGHVARFHPMKDHAGFLRAAVQVAEQRPEAVFLLLGRDVHLENTQLAGIIADELVSRFFFLGERDDVPHCMGAMDLLCTSSAWGEAFPNVLGEAMAMGIPCVATDVGDSAAIVGDTGLVVQPSDAGALASAILELLALSGEMLRARGLAARQRVVADYSLEEVVNHYSWLYSELAKL